MFVVTVMNAQPTNNDCTGVIDLGLAPVCPTDVYTNIGATPYDIDFENTPPCFMNTPENDVWFSFQTDAVITDYRFIITGVTDNGNNAISDLQVGLYRGFCIPNGLSLSGCGVGMAGENMLSFEVDDLTPNETYFLRIDNFGGDASEGDFTLCIEEGMNEINIDQGSSDACTGILYDSGGPDGDYSNNENFVFTICPNEIHQCIIMNLEYFNMESFAESLVFYDGPDTNSPVISNLNDEGFGGPYGGSGVCHTVYATECLTIEFTSDGTTTFEGFKAFWECSLQSCKELQPIQVTADATAAQIEAAISSSLADVTVLNINCPDGSYGTFQGGDDTDLGLETGLLLTSGTPQNAVGPNTNSGITTGHFAPGDADLDILSNLFGDGSASNDACIVELEVTAFTDELNFEYIFGSDEYPEFVGSINDIFALLISGPGITDGIPEIGGQKNLAVLPTNGAFVEINSVNNIDNWEFYRNNGEGLSTEYDGLTSDMNGIKKSLTATSSVIPCETYNLKLAIADRSDDILDSGVFISEITSGVPTMEVAFASGLGYFIEKCTGSEDSLIIRLDEANEDDLVYDITFGGTAVNGADYTTNLPNPLMIPAGTTELAFSIVPIDDGLVEGPETIIISLVNDFGCGEIPVNTIEVELRDKVEVIVEAGQDTIIACLNSEVILSASGATDYTWTPVEFVDDPFAASTAITTDESRQYVVVGGVAGINDPSCMGTDSVWVQIVDPVVTIETDDPLEFCLGDSIVVNAVNNVGDSNLQWVPPFGVTNPDSAMTSIVPFFTGPVEYIVSVELGGCVATDTININVDNYDLPNLLVTDTIVCQGYPVQLADVIEDSDTNYEWTPDDYLDDATIAHAISTPEDDISYQLISTSVNGICADTFMVDITVIPNNVEIEGMDSVFLCKPDSVLLSATSTSAGMGLTWSPDSLISTVDLTGSSVMVVPEVSGYVYLDLDFDGCMDRDSVWVQIDSLPVLDIEVIPARPDYCKGEIITLISPGYEISDYPNIQHSWSPAIGIDDYNENFMNLNVGVTTVETTTYVRETQNGACFESNEIEIIVKDPSLNLSVNDTSVLCPGKFVTLSVNPSSADVEDLVWVATSGDFTITPDDAQVVEVQVFAGGNIEVMAEVEGCPVVEVVTITIDDETPANIIGPQGPFCENGTFSFSVESTEAIQSVDWENAMTNNCGSCINAEITLNGETELSAIVTYVNGCSALASFPITYEEIPVTIVGDTGPFCVGDTESFSVESNEAIESVTWVPTPIDCQGCVSAEFLLDSIPAVSGVVNFANGCQTSVQTTLTYHDVGYDQWVDIIDPEEGPYAIFETVTLEAKPNTDEPVSQYIWTINGETFTTTTPFLDYEVNSEEVNISVEFIFENGCSSFGEGGFNAQIPRFIFPNIFTPGSNDTMSVENKTFSPAIFLGESYLDSYENYTVETFSVFNRWGQKVFDCADSECAEAGWDGTYNEQAQPGGTYVYVFKAILKNGQELDLKKGDVTLLR